MKTLIFEQAGARMQDGKWIGSQNCNRSRCRAKYEYPVTAEHVDPIYSPRQTKEERERLEAARVAFWAEVAGQPLPDGWVQLRIAGEDRITDAPKNFCSAHCAALWLNAYNRGD